MGSCATSWAQRIPSKVGFFPEHTYRYDSGHGGSGHLLKRANAAMKKRLAEAWEGRDPAIVLQTPYEALTMASIVEKETGQGMRAQLILPTSVFENRMRLGMRLQTDPTVIYGLGERYDGNIHKRDLAKRTRAVEYLYARWAAAHAHRNAESGLRSRAVLHPAQSPYLYFVARGDGTHEFSGSLEEHNRAVAKYVLGK